VDTGTEAVMLKKLFVVVACGGCAFLGGVAAESLRTARAATAEAAPFDADRAAAGALSERFEAVVKKIGPAVVSVDAVKPPAAGTAASNKGKPVEESGSGVLVRLPGVAGTVAVTNNHVVGAADPDKVYITLSDGRILRPVRVLADPESDVSLLQLADATLPVAELGDSDRVRKGQWVLAFGSPFGLNQTVTHGIISATDRGQISLGSTIRIKEFLQTDAAINPGSSGGPLVDLDGRVVGINTAIASQSGNNSGVSFSIPANLVRRVATELFAKGTVTRGYLGVQLASALEPAEALRLGLPSVSGALVEIVHPDTPAAAARLRPGDVVLKVEDVVIRDENHFINLVTSLPPGQRVRLSVWRERKTEAVEVVVGEYGARPRQPR
jgi:S1-C subfamily serine protease